MTPIPIYPVNDFGPLMPGLVIGGLGIFHVFLAQFAIGGGWLMCALQYRVGSGGWDLEQPARRFLDGFFRFLVLVSFITGAVTGVGMWFTSIQVSPRTIGVMVDEFHWIWATEWLFFWVEVVAGYCFYRYAPRLDDRTRFRLLVLYSISAWGSLFWINGILSWQLTPGAWLETGRTFDGFFNPGFWPSLLYRTVVSISIAALVAMAVLNAMPGLSRDERHGLIRWTARFLVPLVLTPVLGFWYLQTMPADSRAWAMGGSVAMTMFGALAAGATALLGAYALIGLVVQRLYINGATATLLLALAFGASAGGEFVREGSRKPYTVRETLYSNSFTQADIERLRAEGLLAQDPYPVRDAERYPGAQLAHGALVFRDACSVCHTVDGSNGVTHLTGSWSGEQLRLNISHLQRTKPFMPPFPGDGADLEALVRFIEWTNAGEPDGWARTDDPETIGVATALLDDAGTAPASALERLEAPR